jgi:hypothetical protein
LLQLEHALTGCYYTSKVGTKHVVLNANPSEYLKDVDCAWTVWDILSTAAKKKNATCKTMDQLRIYNYHHSKGVSLDQLAPTSHSVQQHIHRVYYAIYQMIM